MGEPSSSTDAGGGSPVSVRMCKRGRPVLAQVWHGPCADVRRGEPSSSAHVGGVSPDPGADVDAMRESPGAGALSRCAYGVGAACAPCRERCWDPPRGVRALSSDSASACASRCDCTAMPRHAMPSHTRTHAHAHASTHAHAHKAHTIRKRTHNTRTQSRIKTTLTSPHARARTHAPFAHRQGRRAVVTS